LGLQSPTPDVEKTIEEAEATIPRIATTAESKVNTELESSSGSTQMDSEVVKKVEEAADRYEGMSRKDTLCADN
jgi:hypothetical protein